MEIIQNLIEYYDELFPVTADQKKFYEEVCASYQMPTRFLRIGCGAGLFEHQLARVGHDVTGIDQYPELLRSANLRRRTQLMSIRFFEMSTLDMTRFLGKAFYNVISCLENRVVYIHDRTLLRKFFYDCKQLLAPGGCLVLYLYNYQYFNKSPRIALPERASLRSRLFTELVTKESGAKYISQTLENSAGKLLAVQKDAPVYPLLPSEIEEFAREAGFASVEFYANFEKAPFTGKEEGVLAVIR